MRLLKLLNELFAIDAKARDENMDLAARDALRQQQAKPLLDEIRAPNSLFVHRNRSIAI